MKPGEVGMLTEEQVAEIRARCEAATEGPWESTGDQIVTYAVPKTASHPVQPISVGDVFIEYEDAEFCAHAREDIPALLAALDEQAVEIARLKGLACVDYWGCPIPGMTEANDGLRAENERLRACLPDEWCVTEILAEWLRSHGYDGLLSDDCACGLGGDFPACGEMPTDDCRPAYEHPCIPEDCGLSCITGSADFCMRTEKPAAQEATDAE